MMVIYANEPGLAEPCLPLPASSAWIERLATRTRTLDPRSKTPLRLDGVVAVVRRGQVMLTILDTSGEEVAAALRGSGSFLGLDGLVEEIAAQEVWPLTPAEVSLLPVNELKRWLAEQDPLVSSLLLAAARTVGDCNRDRAIRRQCTEARVASFLLCASYDGPRGHGLPLVLRRYTVARLLQMRPETLSRALRRLADKGLVVLRPELRILDRAGLEREVGLG